MKKKYNMNVKRTISQVILLLVFIVLIVVGKLQLWMAIFAISLVLSIVVGRIYCSWICPINTVMRAELWLKKTLKIKQRKTPEFIKKPVFRYAFLVIFLGSFVLTTKMGIKVPIMLILILVAFVITLFFEENMWHRYLCPQGTLFSIVSRKNKHGLEIDKDLCRNCGLCSQVCPSSAIIKDDKYFIEKNECLICDKCIDVCPADAIKKK